MSQPTRGPSDGDGSARYTPPVIIGVTGAVVGKVHRVRPHPQGDFIWLAEVCLGDCTDHLQIVFGGDRKLSGGELVPVAPPGSLALDESQRRRKMRTRNYRGQRSQGMLCSLDELGWLRHSPNEVAVLCDLVPGYRLDELETVRRPEVVVDWERAVLDAKRGQDPLMD
jgi:tRNA-binding EMAP/Myf-like protein